jgi:hypothetical protein
MTTKSHVVRTSLRAAVALSLFTAILGVVATVSAQGQYKQLKPDANLSNWAKIGPSNERKNIESMLRGAASFDQAQFEAFFKGIIFPQFTLLENVYFTKTVKGSKDLKSTVCLLPDMRRQFKEFFFDKATNQQARNLLNDLTLRAMSAIASDNNYHPIARYNAMLLVADLNEDEGTGTPYKPALGPLVVAARNPNMIDSVRVAALIGIVRHASAEGGVAENLRAPLAGVLAQLAKDTNRPAGRSREGHDWIRRRALEALTAMHVKTPPTNGDFLGLLFTLLQEKDSMMELRAEAIVSFLTVTSPAPANFDSAKIAAEIGRVAVDAYHRELATSSQFGRAVDSKGMTYYYTLVERGLAALDKLAPTPKIAELQKSLATLVEKATAEEEVDPETQLTDPLFKEKQFDLIAQSGAEFESLVTGKPVSEILPKRGPVGGNDVASVGFQGGGGRGPGGVGYPRTSGDRSGGHMRLPPGIGGPRGGRGGYGMPSGGRR